MSIELTYLEVNKDLWNEKTKVHVKSVFYEMDANMGFLSHVATLKDIEKNLLGDISGKSILHLQCHFGQDTLSLAKLGANATGVDFSEEAIQTARELNNQLGLDATFICADVYGLPAVLEQQFDIVFTSYGVIGWLPDMNRWAKTVSHFLKPGGKFVMAEFHPVVWMFDNEFTKVQYSYFNKETIVETLTGTYADKTADIKMKEISWNHDLSEVLQNLIAAGLQITHFQEFDYSPYKCFERLVEISTGKYQIEGMEGKIPMVYAVAAIKTH
jgi:2-polyprenyl-3-methyl-5-hydroxy-6-metoxy-1,4-benzoquinol methylase